MAVTNSQATRFIEPYVTGDLYPLAIEPILRTLDGENPFVFLETARVVGEENRSYLFRNPVDVLTAGGPEDIEPLHRAIESRLAQGYYLAGWWTYEWGYALEPKLHSLLAGHRPPGPLVWLGVFGEPATWSHQSTANGLGRRGTPLPDLELGPLELSMDRGSYAAALRRLKEYIAAGDTYQVNYTLKGRFSYTGRPEDLYAALRAEQAVSYGALIRSGERWVLSLSPELFFRRDGDRVWSKPMKGTMRRGRTADEDAELARFLADDPKSRAENVMIVDLLRNDIGRLAVPGTVSVPDLFQVERYETLFQMISRIEGKLAPDTDWQRIFKALFPCGSVTGAPKLRTMEIIAEQEREPRGIYTGAVGFLAPGGRGILNVAIRTVVLENGAGEIGIGSGVVADSDPEAEYAECRLKAGFLTSTTPEFSLIETLRWDPGDQGGYALLDRHLARLSRSALYFGFPIDEILVRAELMEHAASFDATGPSRRVRVLLARDGSFTVETTPLPAEVPSGPMRVALSETRVFSGDPFFFHKTTNRSFYDDEHRRAVDAGLDEYLFCNERGELTEGTRTNLFLKMAEGLLLTPPVTCGLLAGTLREELLATGRAREAILSEADLNRAKRIFLGNSVRGLLPAVVVP